MLECCYHIFEIQRNFFVLYYLLKSMIYNAKIYIQDQAHFKIQKSNIIFNVLFQIFRSVLPKVAWTSLVVGFFFQLLFMLFQTTFWIIK